jgi:hypothetical protein
VTVPAAPHDERFLLHADTSGVMRLLTVRLG